MKVCPVCGADVNIDSFGPFFRPEPSRSFAVQCSKKCWRDSLRETKEEAEKDLEKLKERGV